MLASNNDDHPKNHAFLMDARGAWSLAPAYDLTFAYNPGSRWTKQHMMSVNGEFMTVTRKHLHALGDRFDVPNYRGIIDEVQSAVAQWPVHAARRGVSRDGINKVQARLDQVRGEFG